MKPWEAAQAQQAQVSNPQFEGAVEEAASSSTPWDKAGQFYQSLVDGPGYTGEMQKPWEQVTTRKAITESPDHFEKVFSRLVQAESRGRHTDASGGLTTSPAGARGITQLMPNTAAKPGYGIAPVKDDSEAEYVRVGRQYLTAMVKEFNGDYSKALAAYNAGAGNVKKALLKAANAGSEDWMQFLPRKSETIPYVQKIMKGIK